MFQHIARTPRGVVVALLLSCACLLSSPLHAESSPTNDSDSSAQSTTEESAEKTSPDQEGKTAKPGQNVAPPDTTSPEALLKQASQIARKVAEIRGLPLKHDVAKGIKNREELRKSLIEQFEREYGRDKLVAEGDVLRKLGLIDESVDWYDTLVNLMTEQVAGYYDQRTSQLFVMRGLPSRMQRPAMAHELFHAVQDQHFNLAHLLKAPESLNAGDATLAGRALVEGDAVVTMIDFVMHERGQLPTPEASSVTDMQLYANMLSRLPSQGLDALEQMASSSSQGADLGNFSNSALGKAPRILRRLLVFPYLWGMRWVIRLKQGRSWEEFNEVYDHPPISTEQILHPEAYANDDDPVHLTYKAARVLDGYERIYNTSLGEFQMRLFLQEHLGTANQKTANDNLPTPTEAAAGWDGDRLLGFRKAATDDEQSDSIAVSHVSVWDSTEQATQYFRALRAAMRNRFPDAQFRTSSGQHGQSVCTRIGESTAGERIYIEQWGDAVLHVEGVPSEYDNQKNETNPTMYRLRDYIWNTLNREPLRPRLTESRKTLDSPE